MIRGNKKHHLEHSLQDILWNFAKQVGLSDEYEIKCLVQKFMNKKIAAITYRVGNIERHQGELGRLRGWIKERRTTIRQRVNPELDRAGFTELVFEREFRLMEEFKKQTKLLINGDNILARKKCDYKDLEEKIEVKLSPSRSKMILYYCGKEIDYGYEFCADHYPIIKAKRDAKDLKENQELRAETIDLLKIPSQEYDISFGVEADYNPSVEFGKRDHKLEFEFKPTDMKIEDPDGIFKDMKPFDEDMNIKSKTKKSKSTNHDIAERMTTVNEDEETEILFDDDEEN